MKLSDGEKIIISMLADIHKSMEIKGETDVNLLMESIHGGHLWALKWEMQGILHDHNDSEQVVSETCDILDMWSIIEHSFVRLNDAEKQRVRTANHGHDPKFVGFDGNHEDHFGVAKHLIEVMGRFTEFRDRGLNSHSSVVPRYLQMYGVFKQIRDDLGKRPNVALTVDEIEIILAARA